MPDLQTIAQAVVDANRNGKTDALLDELYSPDCVSAEPFDMPGMGRMSEGLDAIKAKHAWWEENAEMHSVDVSDAYLHGDDKFSVRFSMDATFMGERSTNDEVAIYTVSGGKIVREEFFSPPMPMG